MGKIHLLIFIHVFFFIKITNCEDENTINARCIFVIDYSKVIDFHLIDIKDK